jgi:hypothetical protein
MTDENGNTTFDSAALVPFYLSRATPRELEAHVQAGQFAQFAAKLRWTHRDLKAVAVRWGLMPSWPRSSAGK